MLNAIRLIARERELPVFDRLAIMRHWSDTGVFDLYAATKDVSLAKRVHDCIGRALAALIIDAAHLARLNPRKPSKASAADLDFGGWVERKRNPPNERAASSMVGYPGFRAGQAARSLRPDGAKRRSGCA